MAHWSGIGIPKTNAIALEVSYTHTHDDQSGIGIPKTNAIALEVSYTHTHDQY